MRKLGKKGKIIIIVAVAVIIAAAAITATVILVKKNAKPVNVYPMQSIAMDSYWGDTSETQGMVRTDKMQSVYLSSTQVVTKVFVTEGQEVKAGDQIMSFDTTLSDLELERQRINVEKLELQLKNAKADLAEINGYKPYVAPTPTPEPEPTPLDPMALPFKSGGQGTAEKPYVYLWNDDCWYTDSFINTILPLEKVTQEPAETPDEGEEAAGDEEETPEEPVIKDTYKEANVWVVFENRESDNTEGELIRYWGMHFTRNTDGSYKFSVYTPDPGYSDTQDDTTDPGSDVIIPSGPQYTAAEIAKMRAEKQKEITDVTLQIKVEKVKYEKLQLEINNGMVTAKLDGVVKTIADQDEALMNNTPFIIVSGGGGYYVQGSLSELELDTVKIGQTVTINSWMTGAQTEGEIVEISQYPDTSGNNWTNGNQNVSYYPFTVFVNEDAALQENEYVSIQYSASASASGIYVEKPFVLNENSKYYVYVADENGNLEKREIIAGTGLWGSYINVVSGLTMDDLVAFPYGKNLKVGAKAVEATLEDLYSGSY